MHAGEAFLRIFANPLAAAGQHRDRNCKPFCQRTEDERLWGVQVAPAQASATAVAVWHPRTRRVAEDAERLSVISHQHTAAAPRQRQVVGERRDTATARA